VGNGMLEISHNALAALGLATAAVVIVALGQESVRVRLESGVLEWLQERAEIRELYLGNVLGLGLGDGDAINRATAADPGKLSGPQQHLAHWVARRYRVAPEPVARLVQEAWVQAKRAKLEPHLVLAVLAVESSFNPFAQSPVGAQGLMQVMTKVHQEKYQRYGGDFAAFDPVTNLRVGVQVLRECVNRADGNLEGGLRLYVGAANSGDDGGYAEKVLAEAQLYKSVLEGAKLPANTPLPNVNTASAEPAAPAKSGR
jgi:hypothetical protein